MASPKAFQKRTGSSGDPTLDGWLDLIWQLIKSDVYTPTLTNVTNLDDSTAYQCHYMRVGDVVHVAGQFAANPTLAAPTDTELGMSLPIPSNLSADEQLAGTASNTAGESARILSDSTNNRASIQWPAASTTNRSWSFNFTYRIR